MLSSVSYCWQPGPGAHRGARCGGRSADRADSYLGRSDQPPETSVQPAPPWFSHHVGFLGILRFSAQTLPGSGNTLRMWTGLPRAPGWEWAVGSSDEAGSTEILALLLPRPERWDCGQRRGGRDGGGRGWSAGPPWRLQDQHELSSPGGAAFLSSH